MNLINAAPAVASGRTLPEASSAAYSIAALSWAEEFAEPGESALESHDRLSPTSPTLRALRVAAGVARMLEGDADPTQLLEALGFKANDFQFESRMGTWVDLVELARPQRRDSETLGDTLRRLVDQNSAARCAFFYVVTP